MADYNDCLRHECYDHYHISTEEYNIWETLFKQVREYEHIIAHHNFHPLTNINEIRINLTQAKDRLNEFIQAHNLEKFQNPFLQE